MSHVWTSWHDTHECRCSARPGEVGGWGRDPFSRNFMKPTPRRKWYLTTGRRFHQMVLDPIPQSLPVPFFGSWPQPPTSHDQLICSSHITYMNEWMSHMNELASHIWMSPCVTIHVSHLWKIRHDTHECRCSARIDLLESCHTYEWGDVVHMNKLMSQTWINWRHTYGSVHVL